MQSPDLGRLFLLLVALLSQTWPGVRSFGLLNFAEFNGPYITLSPVLLRVQSKLLYQRLKYSVLSMIEIYFSLTQQSEIQDLVSLICGFCLHLQPVGRGEGGKARRLHAHVS